MLLLSWDCGIEITPSRLLQVGIIAGVLQAWYNALQKRILPRGAAEYIGWAAECDGGME